MSLGRRKVELGDTQAWVFNRMADVYDARPAYPNELVECLLAAVPSRGARVRVVDLGAGIGHLAVPLASRGCDVYAVEPALAMLERLGQRATEQAVALHTLHAKAESVPLPDRCADLVVIADALHFLDAELTAHEVARLLVPGGALALLTCEFADTPFMNALATLMQQAAPRRPRATANTLVQLAAVASVTLSCAHVLEDATAVGADELARILRSISYLGPAMNAQRWAAFLNEALRLGDAVWSRKFTLHCGTRAGGA